MPWHILFVLFKHKTNKFSFIPTQKFLNDIELISKK